MINFKVKTLLILYVSVFHNLLSFQIFAQEIKYKNFDPVLKEYSNFNFFELKGVDFQNQKSRSSIQLTKITYLGNSIKKIEFNLNGHIKTLIANDSLNKIGYKVFISNSINDGGKQYKSIVFMSNKILLSFSLCECWRDKSYFYMLINEGISYRLLNGFLSSTNFGEVIDFVEKNNFEIRKYRYSEKDFIHESVFDKKLFSEPKFSKKSFKLWYNMTI